MTQQDKATEQQQLAQQALEAKQRADADQSRDYLDRQEPTAGDGPVPGMNPDAPVIGAFDAEGHRPVLERSRKAR